MNGPPNITKKTIQLKTKCNNRKLHSVNSGLFLKFSVITPKKENKILLTVDDAFQSFYDNAWPYLKKNQIPFVLFVSTEPVGKNGYMNWDQIKEIEQSEFGVIGHHSHSHDYLIDKSEEVFLNDIKTSNLIFKEKLGYIQTLFSYPFGEYSGFMKDYISENFKIAF